MPTRTGLVVLIVALLSSLPAPAAAQDAAARLPGEMMFPAASADVWGQVQKLLKDLKFGSDKMDRKHQVAVTSWRAYDPKVLPEVSALGLDPQIRPRRIQLHIQVAPRPEPARVAVGSVIEVGSPGPRGERTSYVYGAAVIERWVLGLIADRVGIQGTPIASDWNRRIEDAKRLLPAGVSEPCLIAPGAGKVKAPVNVSKPDPLFPEQGFTSGNGKVVVTGWMTEHGTMTLLKVANPQPGLEHYEASARAAVALWRYEPGRVADCPIAAFMSVAVTYRIE